MAAQKQKQSTVAEEISEKVAQETIPLIQMSGSSKKRKRQEIEEDEVDYHPDYVLPENDLHTPVPNVKRHNYWRGRGKKRQLSEGVDEREFKREKVDGNHSQNQKQQNKRGKGRKNKGKNLDNQQQQNIQNTQNPNKSGKKKRNKGGGQQLEKHQQFQAFDYASVDYSQFRGGGKSVAGTQKPNASFKNKVCSERKQSHTSFIFLNSCYREGESRQKGNLMIARLLLEVIKEQEKGINAKTPASFLYVIK